MANVKVSKKTKRLPGTDLPQDLGRISDQDLENSYGRSSENSISRNSWFSCTQNKQIRKSLLPRQVSKEQYEFCSKFYKSR